MRVGQRRSRQPEMHAAYLRGLGVQCLSDDLVALQELQVPCSGFGQESGSGPRAKELTPRSHRMLVEVYSQGILPSPCLLIRISRSADTFVGHEVVEPTVEKIPVINTIVDVIVVFHDFSKKFPQEIVVWGFLETKFSNIVKVDAELLYEKIQWENS